MVRAREGRAPVIPQVECRKAGAPVGRRSEEVIDADTEGVAVTVVSHRNAGETGSVGGEIAVHLRGMCIDRTEVRATVDLVGQKPIEFESAERYPANTAPPVPARSRWRS